MGVLVSRVGDEGKTTVTTTHELPNCETGERSRPNLKTDRTGGEVIHDTRNLLMAGQMCSSSTNSAVPS